MALTIHDPQEVKLINAWRKTVQMNNRSVARRGGGGQSPPFFLLIQAVPIGKQSYRIICRPVEEPLSSTAVRDVDRFW